MLKKTGKFCGIDEAGRGSLAGPVCAASVYLFDDSLVGVLRDSKKLTGFQRINLFSLIVTNGYYGVGWASVEEIDRYNILQASLMAMTRAHCHMQTYVNVKLALVDGKNSPCIPIVTHTIVRGDSLEPSIMAASIVAKYSRDRYMDCLDQFYPHYGFTQHKGYPTQDHHKMIQTYGLCPMHRKKFGICKKQEFS